MARPNSTAVKDKEHLALAEMYHEHLEILGYNPKTCRSRYLYLNEFLSWRESTAKSAIEKTSVEHIRDYHSYLSERKNKTTGGKLHPKTQHAHLRVLRDFFSLLQEEKGLKENPCSSLNLNYPSEQNERNILTQNEIKELYEVCEDAQERTILSLAYGCGLRAEEMVRLDIRHVQLKDRILIVERGKGNKRRVIPLSPGVAKDLSEYFYYERDNLKIGRDYKAGNFAFMLHSRGGRMQQGTYNKHLKAIIERTENQHIIIKNITLHNLRHSIATHLIEQGIPTQQVRQFLGHSQLETTQIYTHISRDQLRKMSEKVTKTQIKISKMTLRKYLEKQYSPTSIKGYENMIIRYQKAVGERAETAIYADITNYIGKLRKQHLHPKTLRNNLFAIKIYYRYLIAEGKRQNHPCQHLHLKDKINRGVAVENLYSRENLEEFYQNYESKDPKNQVRNKVIISLLIYQALSVLEISQIKKEEINLEEGILKVSSNQKSKGRILDLKPKQILMFHSYLTISRKEYEREANEYFILNKNGERLWSGGINRLINSGKSRKKYLPIKIRQSVIAHLLKEKNDVRIVQAFAGHRRTGSTEAYQKTGFEELRIAIELKHPLQ